MERKSYSGNLVTLEPHQDLFPLLTAVRDAARRNEKARTMMEEGWKESEGQNVFQMIQAHGGPGLWVSRVTWGSTCARIVAVGEFTGPAPHFGNPSVLMDVYTLNGKLKDELQPLPVPGTYKTWRRWPEPLWAASMTLRPLEDKAIAQALHALDKKRQKLPGMRHVPRQQSSSRSPAESEAERVFLMVPFARKEEAKRIGARWSPENRMWWISKSDSSALVQAEKLGFHPKTEG